MQVIRAVCVLVNWGKRLGFKWRFYNACSDSCHGYRLLQLYCCQLCGKSFFYLILRTTLWGEQKLRLGRWRSQSQQMVKAGFESRPVWFHSHSRLLTPLGGAPEVLSDCNPAERCMWPECKVHWILKCLQLIGGSIHATIAALRKRGRSWGFQLRLSGSDQRLKVHLPARATPCPQLVWAWPGCLPWEAFLS